LTFSPPRLIWDESLAQFMLSDEAGDRFFHEEVAHGRGTTHPKPASREF
jgi:hypothetical protein